MNMFKKTGGFTLVELIVVIAILAILAGIAIPAYSGYIEKAQDAAVITELDAIQTAAQAANATAGQIDKIEVTADGRTITVYAPTDKVLADSFDDDFKIYYAAAATVVLVDTDTADNSVKNTKATITLSKPISNWENSSYAEDPDAANVYSAGATWRASDESSESTTKFKAGWNNGVAYVDG